MKHPQWRWKWEKFTRKSVILQGNKSYVSYGYSVVIELVFRGNEAAYCEDGILVNEFKKEAVY